MLNKLLKFIREQEMIQPGDKIAVCISGGKDSMLMAKLMQQLQQENPCYSLMLSAPGDIVTFGAYEQDNDASNGKEPIEWIVLEELERYLIIRHRIHGEIKVINK